MAFMVARTEKRKIGSLSGYQNHVDRKTENHSNKDIDDSKTYLNYDLVGHEGQTSFHEEFMGYINENRIGSRAVRKDAVIMQDWIIGSSQEFFDALDPEDTRIYFETAVEFFAEKFGRENIRFATVHMDEKTPHMHMGIVPMKDGKLTAKTIFDRNCLRMIQNELPQAFQKAGFDIQRGEPKSEKVHLHPEEYKATMRAAQEKAKEITKQAKKEAQESQKELTEQSYDVWEKDWKDTKASFDDFDLELNPFNWDFDGTNSTLDEEYGKTMKITVDEHTPRRFNFSFSEISELFKVKYQALKEYVSSKWQYLSRRETEIEKRENTLNEKETSLETKLESLTERVKLKETKLGDVEDFLKQERELLNELKGKSKLTVQYPDYVKVNKLTGNVTLPKEKWEERCKSDEMVKTAVNAMNQYSGNNSEKISRLNSELEKSNVRAYNSKYESDRKEMRNNVLEKENDSLSKDYVALNNTIVKLTHEGKLEKSDFEEHLDDLPERFIKKHNLSVPEVPSKTLNQDLDNDFDFEF
jgi:Plasmid recombination enzyme.